MSGLGDPRRLQRRVAVSGPAWTAEARQAGPLGDYCRSSLVPIQPEAVEVWKVASLKFRKLPSSVRGYCAL